MEPGEERSEGGQHRSLDRRLVQLAAIVEEGRLRGELQDDLVKCSLLSSEPGSVLDHRCPLRARGEAWMERAALATNCFGWVRV
eukprot:1407984-Alexandrium_andersonii.AAC.1